MFGIGVEFIQGCMVGIEFNWDDKIFLVDLFVIRIAFLWGLE